MTFSRFTEKLSNSSGVASWFSRHSDLGMNLLQYLLQQTKLWAFVFPQERSLQRAIAARQASLFERERRAGDEANRLGALAADLVQREARIEAEQESITEGREELARAVANISTGLRLPAAGDSPGTTSATHVLYLAHDGYRLAEADGRAPAVDTVVEIDGHEFIVTRVGRSPLPGDRRDCAYVESAGPLRQA